jgi:DNA-binding transcriptional LysR family regulator
MTPILNLNDLHCFVLVYEQRSFTRAANLLDTAQSQVSARIQRLERFAGTPLFTRLSHGIMPNRKGELLYEHAKRILAHVSDLQTAVREPRATTPA